MGSTTRRYYSYRTKGEIMLMQFYLARLTNELKLKQYTKQNKLHLTCEECKQETLVEYIPTNKLPTCSQCGNTIWRYNIYQVDDLRAQPTKEPLNDNTKRPRQKSG